MNLRQLFHNPVREGLPTSRPRWPLRLLLLDVKHQKYAQDLLNSSTLCDQHGNVVALLLRTELANLVDKQSKEVLRRQVTMLA